MSAYLDFAYIRQDLIALADACPDPARAMRLRRIARQAAGDPPPPVMPAMPKGRAASRHMPPRTPFFALRGAAGAS